MTFEWFSAVDGMTLSSKDITNYCPHSYLNNRWELTHSEIGCFESHRRIWKIIIEKELNHALIFEDDIYLVPSFLSQIASIIESGLEYDLVKLDTWNMAIRVGALDSYIYRIQIRPLMSQACGAGAYLISRQGCITLVDRSKEYCTQLDCFITDNWTKERIYQLVPSLAVQQCLMQEWQADGMSDVPGVYKGQRDDIDKKFQPRSKGPLWYILQRELRHAGRKLFAKFYGNKSFISKGGEIITVKLLNDRCQK